MIELYAVSLRMDAWLQWNIRNQYQMEISQEMQLYKWYGTFLVIYCLYFKIIILILFKIKRALHFSLAANVKNRLHRLNCLADFFTFNISTVKLYQIKFPVSIDFFGFKQKKFYVSRFVKRETAKTKRKNAFAQTLYYWKKTLKTIF
jgi:hypothetical protein